MNHIKTMLCGNFIGISIGIQPGSDRMLGEVDMEIESTYMNALNAATHYEIKDDLLITSSEDRQSELIFERAVVSQYSGQSVRKFSCIYYEPDL